MRSRISLPIADHPTILDSKNIMAYARPPRFFPPEWDLPQELLYRYSEDLIKDLRADLADLYEYSFDKSIPFLDEYQKIAVSRIKSGDTTRLETEFFHNYLAVQLMSSAANEEMLSIGYQDSSRLPRKRGLYFCIRLQHASLEIWYVGRTRNFRSRWEDHHKLEALQAIQEVTVCCLPLDNYSDEQLDYAERAYIYMLKPVFNGTSYPDRYLRR